VTYQCPSLSSAFVKVKKFMLDELLKPYAKKINCTAILSTLNSIKYIKTINQML